MQFLWRRYSGCSLMQPRSIFLYEGRTRHLQSNASKKRSLLHFACTSLFALQRLLTAQQMQSSLRSGGSGGSVTILSATRWSDTQSLTGSESDQHCRRHFLLNELGLSMAHFLLNKLICLSIKKRGFIDLYTQVPRTKHPRATHRMGEKNTYSSLNKTPIVTKEDANGELFYLGLDFP